MSIWSDSHFLKWVDAGYPIDTSVISISISSYTNIISLPAEIENLPNLEKLYLVYNQLTSLPATIGNLPNLKELYLGYNQLTTFPVEIGNLSNLEELSLLHNQLTSLPAEIGNLQNLKLLYLVHNQLTSLPVEIGNLTTLEVLNIGNNQLTSFPEEIGNLINLKKLNLTTNQITSLPATIGNLPNLKELYLGYNQLTTLPVEIGNLTNLEELSLLYNQLTSLPAEIGNLYTHPPFTIDIFGNPIDYIPPNIVRFLNTQFRAQGIYRDTQSVHNSTVQKTIKESIMRLISRPPVLTSEAVLESIISDDILTDFTKQSLVEYSNNNDLISEVSVTFLEVLTAVWNRIVINEHSSDIKSVLNFEMADAECKCFTGRVSRLVNCLSGVDELVEVKIADNEQIGNVIAVIRDRLKTEGRYTVDLHKEIAKVELKELGYTEEVVGMWLDYIE